MYYELTLQRTIESDSTPIIQLLLEKGADANTQCGPYGSPLHAAMARGDEATIQLLQIWSSIQRADPCGQGDDRSGKEWSLYNVQLLLESVTNINTTTGGDLHETALQQAAANGCESVVRLLLENKANVNAVNASTSVHG